MRLNKLLAGMAVVFAVGLGAAYWGDWREWRRLETENYGQGAGGVRRAEPLKLDLVYQNDVAGIRMRQPSTWTAKEETKFVGSEKPRSLAAVIGLNKPAKVVDLGGRVAVWVEIRRISLPDEVDRLVRQEYEKQTGRKADLTVAEMEKAVFVREREYLGTERITATMLTWRENGKLRKKAVMKEGDKLVTMEASVTEGDDEAVVERTFEEMVRTVVFI